MYKTLNILIFEVNSAGDLSVSHCESFFLAQEHYRAKNKAVSRLLDLIADWTFRYPGVTLFNSSPEKYKLNLQRLWRLLSDSLVIKHDFALTFCSALNAYIFFPILKYLSLQVFIRIMNIVFFLVFLRPQVFSLQLFIVIDYNIVIVLGKYRVPLDTLSCLSLYSTSEFSLHFLCLLLCCHYLLSVLNLSF